MPILFAAQISVDFLFSNRLRHATIGALLPPLERAVQAVLNLLVTSPFLAMRESNQSPAFLTVPKGAVVETTYELDHPGLVRITLQDQPLFAFIRDLRESAELVDRSMSFSASA
jgi:hypothetical protein